MKKILIIIIVAFGSIFAKEAVSQENLQEKYSKLIVGTWKIDSLKMDKNKMANIPDEFKEIARQKIDESIRNTEIIITADKKWIIKTPFSTSINTYEISKDANTIIVTTIDKRQSQVSQIINISNDKMIIEPLNNKTSFNTTSYYYKVRQ